MYRISSSKSKSPSRHNKNQNTHEARNTKRAQGAQRAKSAHRAQNSYKAQNPFKAQNTQKKSGAILTAILSVFAFLGICIFIAILVVRSFGVGHIIRNADILGIMEDFSEGEHAYYIIDQINGLPFNEAEVTLYDIEEFIKREQVTDELERIMDGYATALLLGNLNHHVTVDDIIIAARNIEPELYDFFDHRMTDDDFSHLAHTLDDILDFNSLSLEGIMLDFDLDVSPLPLALLSPVLFWVVGALVFGLIPILFFLRKGNFAASLSSVGIPLALAGLVSFGVGTFVRASLVTADGEPARFSRFLEDPVHLLSQLGLITAAIGVVILIVSLVIRLVTRQGDGSSVL